MSLISVGAATRLCTHRSGWSLKKIPYRSQASRSYLSKAMQTVAKHQALVNAPVGSSEDLNSTGNRISLRSVGLHPNPAGVLDTEKVIDHFESLLPLRIICTADIHTRFELTLRVVPKEGEDRENARGSGVEGQLILEDGKLLYVFGETLGEIRAIGVEGFRCLSVLGDGRVGRGGFGKW